MSLEEVDESDDNADMMPEIFCATIAVLLAANNCFMLVIGGPTLSMAQALEDWLDMKNLNENSYENGKM